MPGLSLKYCTVDSLGVSQFSDGFESGISTRWSGDGVLSTSSPYAGAKCLELRAFGQDKKWMRPVGGDIALNFYRRTTICEGNCYFKVDYRRNGGPWVNVTYEWYTTWWSSVWNTLTCNAGEILIRFQADIYSGDPNYNKEVVFLDDVSVNFNNTFKHAIEIGAARAFLTTVRSPTISGARYMPLPALIQSSFPIANWPETDRRASTQRMLAISRRLAAASTMSEMASI